MNWKNTEKKCYFFNYNSYIYYSTRVVRGSCFYENNYDFYSNGFVYPKTDLTSIEDSFKTTTIKPGTRLYFDQSSGFPRFKLSVSNNKRCIKVPKADYIVVSGNTDYKNPDKIFYVLEDDNRIYIVEELEFNSWFGTLSNFESKLSGFLSFSNLRLTHQGRLYSFLKDNVYLMKYATGEYTVPYITDRDLDKIICNMCPDLTYDELLSIVDMINSEDASVVQLGMKALSAYNVEKYRLTLRLILMTRHNWYLYTKNTVGTKQLIETLDINSHFINDDFGYSARFADDGKTSYTVEDVALSKQIGLKLLKEWLQRMYDNNFRDNNYKWLPDERKIELI